MPDLLPNMDILKSPSNWFFVAFCLVLLIFIFHLIFKDTE